MKKTDNAFNFLRLVTDDASKLPNFKTITKGRLRTFNYYIDFFYKPITRVIEK